MPLKAKKYLYDAQYAIGLIEEFTSGKQFADYQHEMMLSAAVEREFEVVGEALSQLNKIAPSLTAKITDFRRIVDFRNLLIHGYAEVDNRLVWNIVETKLPTLKREVTDLLQNEQSNE